LREFPEDGTISVMSDGEETERVAALPPGLDPTSRLGILERIAP